MKNQSPKNHSQPPIPSPNRIGGLVLCLLFIFFSLLPGPSAQAAGDGPEKTYNAALAYHRKLLATSAWKKRRDKWEACADKYLEVWRKDKKGVWAPAGLFNAAKVYIELEKFSGKKADLVRARELLTQTQKFRTSRYSREARKLLRRLPKAAPASKTQRVKHSSLQKTGQKARPPAPRLTASKSTGLIQKIRYGSLPSKTRIVLDTSAGLAFTHGKLKADSTHHKPQRIWIDIKGKAGKKLAKELPFKGDPRVTTIRTAPKTNDTVRVVVDARSISHYTIFSLKAPHRIVIDVWGEKAKGKSAPKASTPANVPDFRPDDLAKQLALGVRRIVIDPGHGGKDGGAPGYYKGVTEKKVVLAIAKKLAAKLKKELKCEVILTRNSDRFLTLEQRTSFANKKRADLFISIHANASRNRKAYGVETYFLNLAKDRASINVAARENATSEKNISDLHTILNSLMKNAKINESSRLARYVQTSLVGSLKGKYSKIQDKGVKQAPFYVLLGARMPAILVETAFISNKRECKRLTSSAYQNRICDGIVKGVKRYIESTHPASLAHSR
ncbi:MAG: N-acetylmuramoyl-L-alanine amidase [Desulfobacterales bacterium]|nr:N-acetylmuramoyl-L-alanine amidase [Desulfobacterales bacterium]